MPICFRYNGQTAGPIGFGGSFVILCDVCGVEVPANGEHNVEQEKGTAGEAKPVYFFHNDCALHAKSSKPGMNWGKLEAFILRTK